jgi:membrane protease YdiL (CAAX protease family)
MSSAWSPRPSIRTTDGGRRTTASRPPSDGSGSPASLQDPRRPSSFVLRPSSALALAAVLVVYANGIDGLALRLGREQFGTPRILLNVAGVAALLAWARWAEGLGAAELGLGRRGQARSVSLGLLTGLGMALPPLALFFLPHVPGGRLAYQPLTEASARDFLRRFAFEMPVGTAICEEVAFRGVLQALLARRFGARAAVLLGTIPFTLWHVTVTWNTLARTSLPRHPLVRGPALAGSLGAVFAGGLIFAALRALTGSLPAAIAAHWAVDATMLLALFRRRGVPAVAVVAAEVEET